MKTRRLKITVQTYKRLIIKSGSERKIFCTECGRVVQMLKPDEAAVFLGVSSRTIYRWIESGSLHFGETSDGLLLICINSLEEVSARQPKDNC